MFFDSLGSLTSIDKPASNPTAMGYRPTREWLFGKITCKSKKQTKNNNLVKDIKNSSAKVVAMLGAGDIGVTIQEVTNQLLKTIENET